MITPVATVKVAVSIPEELYRQAEAAAEELKMPRSRVYAEALEEYLRRAENRRVSRVLDEVYSEPDPDQAARMAAYKAAHRRQVARRGPEDWGA